MSLALAIDLGGTQLRAALVNEMGALLSRAALATDVQGGPKAIIPQMLQAAEAAGFSKSREKIIGCGICAPGPLDSEAGTVLGIPTLPGWEDFPLRAALAEALGLKVILENDGIAAANGEWRFGAGRGLEHLVYVTVSTGIGGGVVVDGRLMRGRRGMAGHVGHLMIDPNGPRCACGGKGCFEAHASGTALGEAGLAQGFADAKAVVTAARAGNSAARALMDAEADHLAYGFASLLHLYSPQKLIIGGGVSQALDLLAERITARLTKLVMPPFQDVAVVKAALGDDAGLAGMGGLVFEGAG
jgi:glucokinase